MRALLYDPPEAEIVVPVENPTPISPSEHPARLMIPRLKIDAVVQEVGITKEGNMGVPSNFTDVAWYKYGVAPGGRGSAVIAGHVDNGLGLSGVFKNLNELEAGDKIHVKRVDGTYANFVVTGKRSYPYDAVPTEVIFNPSGSPRLNLITCGGSWLQSEKTYDERLVVYAELVS